jgi:hypothetical protein
MVCNNPEIYPANRLRWRKSSNFLRIYFQHYSVTYWQLAAGYWQLVTGSWQLAIGRWLLQVSTFVVKRQIRNNLKKGLKGGVKYSVM